MHAASRIRLGLGCIAVAVALVAGACGDDTDTTTEGPDDTSPTSTSTSTTEDPGSTTEPPTTEPEGTLPVGPETVDAPVYFVAEVTEPAAGGVVEALAASRRQLDVPAEGDAPARALAALLDGPDEFEAEIGYSTAIPEGTELLGLDITDGIATVDLDATFEEPSGAFTDTLRVAQVVFTLTAFDEEVETVQFAIDGEERDVIGTHGIDVTGPDGEGVARDDLSEARPPILVETPAPGATVADPLEVSGEANTFEANVLWALTDPDGEIVDEGFTTATAGTGTWGTFEFSVSTGDIDTDRSGLGALILWEESPEDGRQTNIVEVPVEWPEP